jgi:transposase
VIEAVENERLSFREAAEQFKVSTTWVHKIVHRFRETGDAGAYLPIGAHTPALDESAREKLQAWLREQPDLTQQELADRFGAQGISVERTTVGRTLRELGWTRKKSRSSPASSSEKTSRRSVAGGSTR